ncbi:sigma-70 family RNA polymerase sigma factor [Methylomonas sp. AM2-LC]|uniref:RNA polymerase sigma factor n=1 Tax=Methylomonas sp. AM2-LC TaxID=3153301 RepID=UPI0032652CC2
MPYKKSHLIEKLSGSDHKEIHAFASRRVGQQDAEDIVQDAYLQLLQRDNQESIREPRAFLFRVISNLSIDLWRKSSRSTDSEIDQQDFELDSLISQQPGPEALTSGLLEFDNFLSVLDELPAIQRHAFILNKIQGLTHAEIAERLGVSNKSIQRYLVDAMEHFASRLENFPP